MKPVEAAEAQVMPQDWIDAIETGAHGIREGCFQRGVIKDMNTISVVELQFRNLMTRQWAELYFERHRDAVFSLEAPT